MFPFLGKVPSNKVPPHPLIDGKQIGGISMKSVLHVINGPFERKEFLLEEDVVLVGRGPDNHIRLDEPSVSRVHLKILRRGESFFLVDLNSRNRTRINGKLLEPNIEIPVRTGLHISLGDILVTIGRLYEEEGLIARYTIDLADRNENAEPFLFLKDSRITTREMLERVYEISILLMQCSGLPQLLDRIAGFIVSSFQSIDTMALVLIDEESGEPKELLFRSRFSREDSRSEYSLAVVHRTIEDVKAVIMVAGNRGKEENLLEDAGFKGINSAMCVPLVGKQLTMGALYVHSAAELFEFRRRDLYLLTALSRAAAAALENALLIEKSRAVEAALQKACGELEVRVEQGIRKLFAADERLRREIRERKDAENALRKRTRELDMRYKQVYCLYAISRLKSSPGAGLKAILKGIVALIPPALQYPDIACARLTYQETVFQSAGFQETEWGLKQPVKVSGTDGGEVEVFYTKKSPDAHEGPFLVEECTFLRVMAERVGEIIELKQAEKDLDEAREREMEIGSRIQETLLLGAPPENLSGIRVASMTVASERIDGDFYEFITLSERLLDIIVGDVMGKGVPAALLGAGTKGHFLKALNAMLSPSCLAPLPADIVQHVHNRMVLELIDLDAFVTLTYARFDLDGNRLEFVDCGHPRILHVRAADKETAVLEGHNVPLGFRVNETYKQVSVPFEKGDLFFFYSDGVTEARDAQGRLFGRKRLSRCIQEAAHLSAKRIIDRVRNAVMTFSDTRSFSDDLTCVAVKIGDERGEEPLSRKELELASRLDELEGLRLFVRRACTAGGLEATDEDTQWQIGTAMNEAFSNIVKHAYGGDPEGRIQVKVEVFPDDWVFTLCHRGKPFSGVDRPASPPPDLARDHGFGLIIMDNYMDRVTYSSAADGSHSVRLVKNRWR